MKKILLINALIASTLTCAFVVRAQAAETLPFDYVWEINMGHGRVERGLSRTFKMSDLDMAALHPTMACHDDETLVNGGCSAIYGVTLQGSMPLTFRSKPNEHKWICNFASDMSSALGLDGNKPTTALPSDQLTGATYLVLTCEKKALKPCRGFACN